MSIFYYSDPFDGHHIDGWIAKYIFQTITGDLYLFISMIFASFFISVCLHHCAFSKQFEMLINQISGQSECQEYEGQRMENNRDHDRKILFMLCKLVEFHASTKE